MPATSAPTPSNHQLVTQFALRRFLTPRELEVAKLLGLGWPHKIAAIKLDMTATVFGCVVESLYRKLCIHSAIEVAHIMIYSGLIEPVPPAIFKSSARLVGHVVANAPNGAPLDVAPS